MSFRVTPNILTTQSLTYQQRHASQLARLQEQITSGQRINRPSDDPTGTRKVLATVAEMNHREADLTNIAATRATLNHSFTNLQDAGLLFVRAKEIALSAQQSTEPLELEHLANEVDGLLERLLAIANSSHDGESLFGGAKTDAPPFSKQTAPDSSTIVQVDYAGSVIRAETVVGKGIEVDRIYSGDGVFQQTARGATLLIGGSGAASGAGTDTSVGSGRLTIRHSLTTYAGASGIQAGTSSAAGDTIIGPSGAHTLSIVDTSGTGTSGTVSLNGGPAIPFSSTDTDLRVEGPAGESVFVDTSGITPGFSGSVDIQADGTLSVDDGLTEVALDYSTNQVLTHGIDQSITHIDSSGIRNAGVDGIEYGGTSGAFEMLIELRDALRNPNVPDSPEWHAAIARRIGDIDRVHDHLLSVTGEQAVTLQQLDVLEQRYEIMQLEGERIVGELASTDLSEVAIRMQQEQTLLEMTLASSARLFDQSILDFLR